MMENLRKCCSPGKEAVVKGTVHEGKVRNPLLAGAFGLLAGILMFGTFHGVRYAIFRAEGRNSIVDKLGALFESDVEPGKRYRAANARFGGQPRLLLEPGYAVVWEGDDGQI